MNYESDSSFTSVSGLLSLPPFIFYVKHIVKGQRGEEAGVSQSRGSRPLVRVCACARHFFDVRLRLQTCSLKGAAVSSAGGGEEAA